MKLYYYNEQSELYTSTRLIQGVFVRTKTYLARTKVIKIIMISNKPWRFYLFN